MVKARSSSADFLQLIRPLITEPLKKIVNLLAHLIWHVLKGTCYWIWVPLLMFKGFCKKNIVCFQCVLPDFGLVERTTEFGKSKKASK